MNLIQRLSAAAVVYILLLPLTARAALFYVAPAPLGSDSNPGTEDKPFLTMQQAQTAAAAGDTVYFRAGTYAFVSTTAANGVTLNKSGQAGKPIIYSAYPNEQPIFDFAGMSAAARITGLRINASWIHLKGLELKGVPQNLTTEHESWGIHNTGSNNVYERLNLHHHMGPGLFIAQGGNNLILNCDSHHNYDPKSSSGDGTNADGFGCHAGTGATGNIIRGCRAWWNSDDGYDFIQAQEPVTVEDSWAWSNGYQPDTMTSKGDGNGFKAGGYGLPATNLPASPPVHIVQFCVAWLNKASGFYANHHPVADHFYNNTAFRNRSANFNMLGLNGNVGVLRNNLAYGGTLLSNETRIDAVDNSWTLPVMISDADFLSVSPNGMDGPRQADGSLPHLDFMRLQPDSDLIDKGQDLSLPFAGAAPDLGAFENGLSTSTGAGGSAAAGRSATAGVSGQPAAVGGGSGGGAMPGPDGVSGAPGEAGSATLPSAGTGSPAIPGTNVSRNLAGNPDSEPAAAKSCACRIGTQPTQRPAVALGALLTLAVWRARRKRSRT